MTKYEYKSVEMPFREGDKGWRLRQIVMPAGATGQSDKMIAIFERERKA